MFKDVSNQVNFPELEASVLEFWREREIFKKSVEKDAPQGNYTFYEGPPTANGLPGIHHVISRAFKDLFPRFKTMQGYRVGRKGGWDTHGLPVELEIEKRLGFKGKKDIEDFGIAEFNKLAKNSVFENIQEWNDNTERIGFWVDLENAYVTYDNDYIESCWWVLKSLWERDLLFEDYKVNMHCPRCNTSLASHEVSQGYEDNVDDPSVWPKFPLTPGSAEKLGVTDRPVYMLAWTTTPWTLPANSGLAVKAEAEYGLYETAAQFVKKEKRKKKDKEKQEAGSKEQDKNQEPADEERTTKDEPRDLIIMATALAEKTFGEGNYELVKTVTGAELNGLRYSPIMQARVPADEDVSTGFRIINDDFVEIVAGGEGTGVVHLAPAYGDLDLGREYGLPTLFSVDLNGQMYPEVKALDDDGSGYGPYTKQFFKDADKQIAKDLLAENLLYRAARIKHTYPFCWRCKTPLLFYAKSAWYLKTTAVKDKLISNNQAVDWTPDHIRDGRFGKWLEGNIDWALSRERYWGCPLPMWVSDDGSENHCVGSIEELSELTGNDHTGLELHRPYVDDITFEKNGKTFRRVPYTVDVWFESGAMPYAQWHYMGDKSTPQEKANFEANFPADYICEAIDQTRGWFYSLHALSTLMTYSGDDAGDVPSGYLAQHDIAEDTSAFKHVICLGHILDGKGEKMSKSKGNIVEPDTVLNKQGADALRWYLYSSAPPGNSRRFSEALVDETLRDFLLTLWNTYSFFVLYANLDKPDLTREVPVESRPEIDRWLVARTQQLVQQVTEGLESYDPTPVARAIRDFVVDELSNWYVRRNRRRFWKSESDTDKLAAYKTLHEALVTVAQLIAPMTPFVSEEIFRNLQSIRADAPESVHLSAWPVADESLIDHDLLRDMNALLRVVELGRSARNVSGVKIRQPLPEVLVRVKTSEELKGLEHLEDQLLEELNVKKVSYLDVHAGFVDYTIKPNLPLIGKRLGKNVPAFKKKMAEVDTKEIATNVREGRDTVLELNGEQMSFEPEAFLLEAQSPEGYSAAEDGGYLAALNVQLTPELLQEGLARDVIRLVQNARKNADLDVSDRIKLGLATSGDLAQAIETHKDTISYEVLAEGISEEVEGGYSEDAEIEGSAITVSLKKV